MSGTLWSYHTSPGLFKLNYYIRKNSLSCLNFYNLGDSSIAFTPLFTSPPNPVLSFSTASTCGSCRRATFRLLATLSASPHQEGSFSSDGRGRSIKVPAFFLCPWWWQHLGISSRTPLKDWAKVVLLGALLRLSFVSLIPYQVSLELFLGKSLPHKTSSKVLLLGNPIWGSSHWI